MLIRKNTKSFKAILNIISACKDKPNRKNLVRLYITKAGHSIKDRISTEALQGDSDVFYELNYDAVLNNLTSPDRQLHQSDDITGIYFFQTNTNKIWDETPFEFDESIKKEFSAQTDLPILRKKEAVKPYALPVAKTESKSVGKKKPEKKNIAVPKKPSQPNYGLKQKIEFTDLTAVMGNAGKLTKKDVLDYYHAIADYILPHLKDRPISIKPQSSFDEIFTIDQLTEYVSVPDWFQKNARATGSLLTSNDKDHLLWYIEMGCVEFQFAHSKIKTPNSPDYSVITIHSEENNFEDVIDATIAARVVLQGLQFPSFIKTDGHEGLHIYLPLDTNSTFESSEQFAEYLCKLIRLKKPELISVHDPEADRENKIVLDYSVNESGKYIIAPYSLVAGDHPVVATPLNWESIDEDFNSDLYYHAVQKTLDDDGDPMKNLFKKKVDVRAALQRLEINYAFLF